MNTVKMPLPPLFPDSDERVLRVGGAASDIPGFTDQAVSRAIALLAGAGGTVLLDPGVYTISAPVRLASRIRLVGDKASVIFRKAPGVSSPLALDADYNELGVTVRDASGFRPGMGVAVTDAQYARNWDVSTARITAIQGNMLSLDAYLVRDYDAANGGYVHSCCSMISIVDAEKVSVSGITLEGSRSQNDRMDSCRGGGIYIHRARSVLLEDIAVIDYNGDGISWQTTEDVVIRRAEVSGCSGNGIHPGTGTRNTLLEDSSSHHNDEDGLFVCWRVIGGTFRRNRFCFNGRSGINIGHKDTDNLFEENICSENALYGLHLRPERADNAPHRCVYRSNRFEKNGSLPVRIESPAEALVFEDNLATNAANAPCALLTE